MLLYLNIFIHTTTMLLYAKHCTSKYIKMNGGKKEKIILGEGASGQVY